MFRNAYSATVLVLLQALSTQKAPSFMDSNFEQSCFCTKPSTFLAEKQHFSASESLCEAVAVVGFHQVLVWPFLLPKTGVSEHSGAAFCATSHQWVVVCIHGLNLNGSLLGSFWGSWWYLYDQWSGCPNAVNYCWCKKSQTTTWDVQRLCK